MNFPICTFITYCTFIRYFRVIDWHPYFFAIFKPDIFRKPFHKAFTDVICCPAAVLGLKIAVGMPSRLLWHQRVVLHSILVAWLRRIMELIR